MIDESENYILLDHHLDSVLELVLKKKISVDSVEIIEVLSKSLIEVPFEILVIDQTNFELLKALQAIGFVFHGYLCKIDNHDSVVSIENIDEITEATSITGITLGKPDSIRHSISLGSQSEIYNFRSKERYLDFISNFSYLSPYKKHAGACYNPSDNDHKRSETNFSTLINKRHSADGFKKPVALELCELVVQDTLSFKNEFTRMIGCAGGLGEFDIYLSSNDNILCKYNFINNVFKNANLAKWDNRIFSYLCGNLPTFKGCKTWLTLVVNLKKIREKYGLRAYRFALLNSGGALQQMHLSAESYNLDFRILGGYDDKVIETALKLGNEEIVIAICGVGVR